MRNFHRALLQIACGLALLCASTSRADTPKAGKVRAKLAFVDVERCVGETEDGLRAKSLLKKFSDRKQMQIAQLEDNLKREQDKLTSMAQSTGPTPQLTAAVLAYQKQLQAYNETLKHLNSEIAAREEELFGPIEKKVKGIFTRIGEAEGYDLIVDKKTAPIAKPELDLTERVINEYNWGRPSSKPATAPSAAPNSSAAPASSAPAPASSTKK